MDLKKLLEEFADCECGEKHSVDIRDIIIEHGVKDAVGEIIKKYTDKRKIYFVSDNNALKAAPGVRESLVKAGFVLTEKIYDDVRVADMCEVEAVRDACRDCDIVLSLGSGSCNDICRLGSAYAEKPFILFATAPSMDGLASDTAPITLNNFKKSYQARQPFLILADTEVLAKAPKVLKGAGFGDMMAKYVGLVDWHVSNILTGEKICPKIENLTWTAAEKIRSLADRVTADDEESAKAVAEALILTGIAMKFAHSSRPASGSEHIISHYWEIKKLEAGKLSDFHGRKVAVATLIDCRIYHALANIEKVTACSENIDWDDVRRAYGDKLYASVDEMNKPEPITAHIDPKSIEENWDNIRSYVRKYLPTPDEMEKLLIKAGAPTTLEEIEVTKELGRAGIKYQSFMRRRITLLRILPMISSVSYDDIIRFSGI